MLAVGAAQVALLVMVAVRFGMVVGRIVGALGVLFGPIAFLGGMLVGPSLMLIGGVGVGRCLMAGAGASVKAAEH